MGLALLVGLAAYIALPVTRGAVLLLVCLLPLGGLFVVPPRYMMAISFFASAALLLCACGLWQLDPLHFQWADDGFSALMACCMTWAVGAITRDINLRQQAQCEHQQALRNTLDNLHKQATKDLHTGLPNQTYMREWLRQAAKRSQRSGQPLSLALMARDQATPTGAAESQADAIDLMPDELAFDQWVACANQVFRENDVTARWSSEALLVLFEGSSPKLAREGLTRLRNETGCVAFSSGVLAWQPGESIDEALNRANTALQRARQAGGQRDELA
jgi:GGDEF domain-containing protein